VRRRVLFLIGLLAVTGSAAAFSATRRSGQPQVSADALPLMATAHVSTVYVDCSKVNAVAYFNDNPCETFLLLAGTRYRSASAFWNAETHRLRVAGWRHSAAQAVDYDVGDGMATRNQSWVSRDGHACAYIATVTRGAGAEAPAIFPADPYDIPSGVYAFYRKARTANPTDTLWVRLRSPNRDGRCIG
jgi:hypothetical protein